MPTTPKGCKQFILQLSCRKDTFVFNDKHYDNKRKSRKTIVSLCRHLKETLYLFDEYHDMLLYDMYMYNILHAQYNFKIGAST